MYRLKKRLLCLLAVCCALAVQAASLADEWALLPAPQKIEKVSGSSLRPDDVRYIVARDCAMPVLYGWLDRLPRTQVPGVGVTLAIDSVGMPDSPEGYVLAVNGKGVTVRARSEAGLMYGCVTLDQLLTQARELGKPIPAMVITDYPTIDFRAIHIDTKHHLDRMENYYALIDRLAQWKVNAVIWEIEDKLQFERRPECSSPNAISKQEMQALSRYGQERNVEINPLVQGLGHAGFILKHHWELRENPNSDWEFCPSDPRTYELQFDLYRDALEAMPYGRYLHVGGDEISAIGIDERCKATGKTPFELQMMWLQRVCDFAKENGRTPIFWDDMPLKYAGLWRPMHQIDASVAAIDSVWNTEKLDQGIDLFPKDCVYMRWQYGNPDYYAHRKALEWYRDHDLMVMGATAAADGGSPFMPRFGSKTPHIRNFCKLTDEYGLEGIFATSWDDGSPHSETFMRGFAALGEWGWNPQARTEDEFKRVHARREYGLEPGSTDFIEDLEAAATFFDSALVVSGRRNPAWGATAFKLMDLPDASAPGEWSKRYEDKLAQARAEVDRHDVIMQKIANAQGRALRNRYALDVYEQNAHLFYYPVELLLALEAYDQAEGDDRQAAKERVAEVVAGFAPMRQELEQVYSSRRFLDNPTGYIKDMNHHNHLAAITQDNSWLYLYEVAMNRKLADWLR